MDLDECSASAFKDEAKLKRGTTLLDVRNRADFEQWKIDQEGLNILNLPYDELLADGWNSAALNNVAKDQTIFVICYRGNSSHRVTTHLNQQGFKAKSIHGGMRAWGELYDTHQIHASSDMEIYQFARMGKGCLSYLVISDKKALIIDPTRHIEPYLEVLKQKQAELKLVIDTHTHADHISGGQALAELCGASYLLHPYDAIHPIDLLPASIHFSPLWDGQHLQLGKVHFQVIHVPGHTLGNVALLLEDRFLFGGDTLFIDSIGRPDLGGKESWSELHYRSLQKLHALNEQVLLLPGHCKKDCACVTLADVKKQNGDFMLAKQPLDKFKASILSRLPVFPEGYIDIKRINLGLIEPTEDKMSKLEAGKNLCAVS